MRGAAVEIYTSHWRSPLLADADAVFVSISRGQPRWPLPFAYRRLPALAPGDRAWREEDTERFEAAYAAQLEALGAERVLADLERIAAVRAAVLLCWERPHEGYCHRWTLARLLRVRAGVEVRELRPGMLPRREDALEMRLF